MNTSQISLLFRIVFSISVITIISGLFQVIKPGIVLSIIGGKQYPESNFSFAIVGMFMVLFGSLAIHALCSKDQYPIAIFWCSLQKLGASVAVGVGVFKAFFSPLALLVVGFDFLSFLVLFIFWLNIRNNFL